MGRGPEAASVEMVEAALGAGGEAVCAELVGRLRDGDKAVVERAARTLKKISERDGAALFAWRKALVDEAFRAVDVRVQWNLSLVLGRLPLRGRDKAVVVDLMFERLRDRSGLNRTCALQALMDLSANDAALRRRARPILEEFVENGTPAMKARARKLLALLRSGAGVEV
jgi:hypothetical protein